MRRLICLELVLLMVISLSACAEEPTLIGVWEEKITVSVLGKSEQQGNHPALLRFTFAEDGTGTKEIIPEAYPDEPHVEKFTYSVDGDKLVMTFVSTMQGEVSFEYTMELTSDSLKLSAYGATNNLKRVK